MSSSQVVDFGPQPISNRFLDSDRQEVTRFSLSISVCSETGLVYLDKPFPVDEVRPRYDWLTCFEPEDHLDKLVDKIIALPGVDTNSVIGGYSFKDDSTLKRLNKKIGCRTWRVDPKKDLGVVNKKASIETFQSIFTDDCARKIMKIHGRVTSFM